MAAALPGAGGSSAGSEGSGESAAGVAAARAGAIIPADLDGELSQQLQKLSKRDATTKLKALQVREEGTSRHGSSSSVGSGARRQALPGVPAAGPRGPGWAFR